LKHIAHSCCCCCCCCCCLDAVGAFAAAHGGLTKLVTNQPRHSPRHTFFTHHQLLPKARKLVTKQTQPMH
jgi:hypothetical protein